MRILALAVYLLVVSATHVDAECVGDCKGTAKIDIADLIIGVNITLGIAPVSECPAFANAAGVVDIAQLVRGVNNALNGCARFIDNRDGTITDIQTRLMWEKKIGLDDTDSTPNQPNPHDANNSYAWAGQCSLSTSVSCQPNAAAAAACVAGVQGDQTGCAQCPPSEGICKFPYAYEAATTTIWDWVTQLNAAPGFAGYTDWRVPTMAELESIIDYTKHDPATDIAFNGTDCGVQCQDLANPACSCTKGLYWAAVALGWALPSFATGHILVDYESPYDTVSVRAVRGGSATPVPRFVDNGDGTITDRQTGLMWEKKIGLGGGADVTSLHDADNLYYWRSFCAQGADYCQPSAAAAAACARGKQGGDNTSCAQCPPDEGVCLAYRPGYNPALTTIWDWLVNLNAANFAGHSDWRMPTVSELETIANYTDGPPVVDAFNAAGCGKTCIDITSALCSCMEGSYWTATSDPRGAICTWEVGFPDGIVDLLATGEGDAFHARAVRGGF